MTATATLSCFTPDQLLLARRLLSTQVAIMMGRKMEEGDWAKVYCGAKGIPVAGWSNLAIDVAHGNLGVEQKMICRRSDQTIMASCGSEIMHPAGTRSIRIPDVEDATEAARNVLRQYAELIAARTQFVNILDRYNHSVISRDEAAAELMVVYSDMKKAAARKLIPPRPIPTDPNYSPRETDLRTGWLLWQDSLREFLYFEVKTVAPNPADYYAIWSERAGGGRRKKSRNLWVFHNETKQKHFSITTEAGAKIQPYFRVPVPDDPNLYHFITQGEQLPDGKVRLWITEVTAAFLQSILGSIEAEVISKAVLDARPISKEQGPTALFTSVAVEIVMTADAYGQLRAKFPGVSDEHMVQQMLLALKANEDGRGKAL